MAIARTVGSSGIQPECSSRQSIAENFEAHPMSAHASPNSAVACDSGTAIRNSQPDASAETRGT